MQFEPKTQIVYSIDGRLRTNGAFATDVEAVVRAIPGGDGPIVIWFHGGLISTSAGLDIATRVGNFYSSGYPGLDADTRAQLPKSPYPLFFVWESGPGKSLFDAVSSLLERSIITSAIRKLADLLGFKLEATSILGLEASGATETSELSSEEEAVLFDALMSDSDFVAELNAMKGARVAAAPGLARPTSAQRLATNALNDFIAKNLPDEPKRSLSLNVTWAIVAGMAKIAKRVLTRIHGHRGHGTLQTVIEETVRELKIPQVWQEMKKYCDQAFEPEGVGTLFLRKFKDRSDLADRPIFLVGHSTGAIYITNLLRCADASGLRFHVRFLAPAIRFDRFHRDISSSTASVGSFRSYGMRDSVEAAESLLNVGPLEHLPALRDLYRGSLLYMVSGGLEQETEGDLGSPGYGDCPLLGMERYFLKSTHLSPLEQAIVDKVRHSFPVDQWIYGPTPKGAHFPCSSTTHGGFDDISGTHDAEPALWSLLLIEPLGG